jgi:hypothetical protein
MGRRSQYAQTRVGSNRAATPPLNTIRVYLLLTFFLQIGLSGCAATNGGLLAPAEMKRPMHILVIPSPMKIDPALLQKVLAPDSKSQLSASDEPISTGINHAQEYALTAMKSVLGRQPRLVVLASPAEEMQLINDIRGRDFETPISQEEANRIRVATGADALLRYRITDYGLTPRSWRTAWITFEVTSTLAIAAVIAYSSSTVAKGAAGAYLVQEAIEETAETYAGFWALDVICRPVRIEAQLIQLNPVGTVWKTSNTGLSDIRISRLTRTIEPAERDKQLDQATNHAVNHVASNLCDALENIERLRTVELHPQTCSYLRSNYRDQNACARETPGS